ncbi:hypothetical protein C8F01DRAFT_1266153 [Mycena amicta]|nr:hypothetical protein C8F01DRAFT_1266153 [Mycena amicta]
MSAPRRGRTPRTHDLTDYDDGQRAQARGDQMVEVSIDGQRMTTTTTNIRPLKILRTKDLAEEDNRLAGWTPIPALDYSAVSDIAQTISSYDEEPDPEIQQGNAKRPRYARADDPMGVWMLESQLHLDELLRREGLGDHLYSPRCDFCNSAPASPVGLFRCKHCSDVLHCETCIRTRHQTRPLHSIQQWNGQFWEKATLHKAPPDSPMTSLDMVFQVGHGGLLCANPRERRRMTVVDVRGIFGLTIQLCGCERGQRRSDPIAQLIAHGWYPATTTTPETCATLEALEMFRLLNVVGNLNVNDFIGSLERLTEGARLDQVPDRYRAFFRMSRQYTYLTRAKRCGQGHTDAGLDKAEKGSLTVSCWACPEEGRNLPQDWDSVRPKDRYLYKLILAMDANFRLKNRIRKNEHADPPLGAGKGYFVMSAGYKEHLKNYIAEKEVSTCAAFAALLQMDSRMTTGLRVSGVGGCVCARHGLVRRQGLGDLQKGERYANMDYICLSTLEDVAVKSVLVSYDIACQWRIFLPVRAERIRAAGGLATELQRFEMQFALPVWHAAAHEPSCQAEYSLSYTEGVGKTDGEGIERTWAVLNPVGWATKEMGPGAQHDAIEDKVDHLNFEKNIGQGKALAAKLVVALAECKAQEAEFAEMDANLRPETRRAWERIYSDWRADHSKLNPFIVAGGKKAGPSEKEIMEDLKAAELAEAREGRAPLVEGKVTAAAFVKAGLQLEESQRRILAELKEKTLVSADRSSQIQELRFALFKKLQTFEKLQETYMPGVASIRAEDEEKRDETKPPPNAEHVQLYLPSDLSAPKRATASLRSAITAEAQLRAGQCADSLQSLRSCAHTRQHLIWTRNANAVGQRATTRYAGMFSRVSERIDRTASKYRRARDGLVALKGTAFAEARGFLVLEDSDIGSSSGVESDAIAIKKLATADTLRSSRNEPTKSAMTREVSWIWRVGGGVDETELHDSVRVEWSKSKARRDRWREEVQLCREEMKRVVRYLHWTQNEWERRGLQRVDVAPDLGHGIRAYAARQKSIHLRIGEQFYAHWSKSIAGVVKDTLSADWKGLLEGTAEDHVDNGDDEREGDDDDGDDDDGNLEVDAPVSRYLTRSRAAEES